MSDQPEAGGAQIHIRDPRMSRLVAWAMGVFGTATVLIGTWIATSINDLTRAVDKASVRIEYIANAQAVSDSRNESRNDGQDSRLNQLERDVSTIQGRNMRGQEPTRVR